MLSCVVKSKTVFFEVKFDSVKAGPSGSASQPLSVQWKMVDRNLEDICSGSTGVYSS